MAAPTARAADRMPALGNGLVFDAEFVVARCPVEAPRVCRRERLRLRSRISVFITMYPPLSYNGKWSSDHRHRWTMARRILPASKLINPIFHEVLFIGIDRPKSYYPKGVRWGCFHRAPRASTLNAQRLISYDPPTPHSDASTPRIPPQKEPHAPRPPAPFLDARSHAHQPTLPPKPRRARPATQARSQAPHP